MKIKKRLYFLSALLFGLSSCGGEMQYWPYCSIPDETETADEVSIAITRNIDYPDPESMTLECETFVSEDVGAVAHIHRLIEACKVSPRTYSVSLDYYQYHVRIAFSIYPDFDYIFEFVSLGVTTGYFIFDESDEIYAFKGDFVGVVLHHLREYADSYTDEGSTDICSLC